MSFDLTLMTDSASVPAGRERMSEGGQANWREPSNRQKKEKEKKATVAVICSTIKGEQFQFLFFPQRISTRMFSVAMRAVSTEKGGRVEGVSERGKRGGVGGGGVRGVGRGEETLRVQRRGSERRGVRIS